MKKSVRIGPLKSGELTKYGYSLKSLATKRRSALKRSVKAYGRGTLIKKLNVLSVLHKNRYPVYSRKARYDMKYVQKHF
jgi:hypothetical protein